VITLEQGVRFVLQSFEDMEGGEIFVPKIPSVSIGDIAQAVAPECKTKVIGIRPGEKMHECMIPADEARLTLEFKDHFIVQPSARPWSTTDPKYLAQGTLCPDGFNYSSDNNTHWLSVPELRDVIAAHCGPQSDTRLRIAA